MTIKVVDYMITARCNLHCPFCYGPDPHMKGEMSKEAALSLVEFLYSQTIESIIIAGGEPLISPYLGDVIDRATSLGIKVTLQTNTFWPEKLRVYLPILDWLAVPIDGFDDGTCLQMRTSKKHLDKSLEAISMAQKYRKHGLKLKIGTVVTPFNLYQLIDIAKLVASIKPDIWKWYQVRPRGAGFNNHKLLFVPSETILKFEGIVRQYYPELPLTISMNNDAIKAYLIINPDSEILIPKINDYMSFGHLILPSLSINYRAWQSAIEALDIKNHEENIRKTFPSMLA